MENGFKQVEAADGLVLYKIPAFEKAGCTAVFTSRRGGVSEYPYESLNLGYHVGDEKEKVIENRKRVCNAMGWDLASVVCGEQVHGDKIAVLTEDDKGKGAFDYETCLPRTDALVTDRPDIVLATFYADCVPLFIFDPVKKAVAVSHAGWKGTFAMIGPKTLAKMTGAFGTDPANCLMAIGPSVGPCCYEVDEGLLKIFKDEHDWWERVLTKSGSQKWRLDLWEANRIQMLKAGVREENLITSRICTSCNNDNLFSYRREKGRTGRMGAFISLGLSQQGGVEDV